MISTAAPFVEKGIAKDMRRRRRDLEGTKDLVARISVQRCLFHVFASVKRCTTNRPKLQVGVELYGIAKAPLHVKTLNKAAEWLVGFQKWCITWEKLLKERTIVDGCKQYKHEELRKARRIFEKPCRGGTLFTYLDRNLLDGGPIDSASNKIESSNAAIAA